MPPKYVTLTDPLYEYVVAHRTPEKDGVLEELRAATEALGEIAEMLISREQGSFLTMLVKLMQARNVVEVGTFTGYSAICLARGLEEGGKLTCFDLSEEWTCVGRTFWKAAELEERIELRLGDASALLGEFEPREPLDLAFIDANKTGYDLYYELLLPNMRPGGLVIFDNMLWHGALVKLPLTDPDAMAIDALNRKLASDSRVESVLLPLADGLHLCRKL